MHEHAEPRGATVFADLFVLKLFLFFLDVASDGLPELRAATACNQERHCRCKAEGNAEDEPGEAAERRAEYHRRQAQHRIAGYAAEPGRKRPGTDVRQRGSKGRPEKRSQDPEQAAPFFAERLTR